MNNSSTPQKHFNQSCNHTNMKGKKIMKKKNNTLRKDDTVLEDTVQLFLKKNPLIRREALEDFGVKTGVVTLAPKSDSGIVKMPCLLFPLYDEQGMVVNDLIIFADQELTYMQTFRLRNQEFGILCSQALYEFLTDESKQLERVIFCTQILDTFLLTNIGDGVDVKTFTFLPRHQNLWV